MPQSPQSFRNHTRFFPLYHFVVAPLLFLNFLNSIRHLYNRPARDTAFEMVMAATLVMLGLVARIQALTVQDRVVRLEMRLRLLEVLPADLRARIGELTRGQMVALRFASDAELPELVRQVLAGQLTTQKAIKERIQNWQGDYLRA